MTITFKIFILIFFLIFAVVIEIWINHLKQIYLQYEEEDKLVRESVREDNNCEKGFVRSRIIRKEMITVEIDKSDLLKVLDVLKANEVFHRNRDLMNGSIHLAKEVRFSPITSETINAVERLEQLLKYNYIPSNIVPEEANFI